MARLLRAHLVSSPHFLLCSAIIMSLRRGRVEAVIKITRSPESYHFVASTRCFFTSIKTLVMPTKNSSVPAPSLGTSTKPLLQWQRSGHHMPAQQMPACPPGSTLLLPSFPREPRAGQQGRGAEALGPTQQAETLRGGQRVKRSLLLTSSDLSEGSPCTATSAPA